MAANETIRLDVILSSEQFRKEVSKIAKGVKGVGDETKKMSDQSQGWLRQLRLGWLAIAAVVTQVVRAISNFAKASIKAASEFEEANAKFSVVFKTVRAEANKMREELVRSYAMSTTEATRFLSTMQDMFVPMGLARDKAAEMSGEVVKLAADLGSFNDLPTADFLLKIQSALAGEAEPLRRFGVDVRETAVRMEALNLGLIQGKEALTAQARAQAVLSIITRESKDAIGDMARTYDSFANTMKRVRAFGKGVKLVIGQELVRAFEPAVKAMADFIGEGEGLEKVQTAVVGVVEGVRILGTAYMALLSVGRTVFAGMRLVFYEPIKSATIALGQSFLAIMRGDFTEAKEVWAQAGLDIVDRYRETFNDRMEVHKKDFQDIQNSLTRIQKAGAKRRTEIEDVAQTKILNNDKQAITKRKELFDKYKSAVVTSTADLLNTIAGALGDEFKGRKAVLAAAALLDGLAAEMKAINSAPWPWNLPAIAATSAMVVAQLSKIDKVSAPAFARGGIAGRSGAEMIQVGERGPEAVLPANLTRLLLDRASSGDTNNTMTVGEGAIVVNVSGGDPTQTKEAVYQAVRDLSDDLGREQLFRG